MKQSASAPNPAVTSADLPPSAPTVNPQTQKTTASAVKEADTETSPPSPAPAPTIRRRLATLVYEGVILFGIVFIAGYLFSTLTQQRNGLEHRDWLAAWIGIVVGVYFAWCWTHGGQTLPMKTWRLRVVRAKDGTPLSWPRALARYVLAWLWFLPPLALHPLFSLTVPHTLAIAGLWFIAWASIARLFADRQFLHDRLAGTRIVSVTR
jgi:uncharacterized RDD family membrane protein YckC